MVPSYSADLLLLCIENHCCLCSKLKSLWFLVLKNQPASRQVSQFLFIVLLIKLGTPYQSPGQSVHMLIVNKCSWISPILPFSVGMSGISSCTREQECLCGNNSCISLLAEISLSVSNALEGMNLALPSEYGWVWKRNDGLIAEISEKQTATKGNGRLNGKEVSKELRIWP